MTKIDPKLKSYVITILRKASSRFKPKQAALVAARVRRGVYICAICGEETRRKDLQMDHVNPVVGEEGFTTFDDYISRLFCDQEGWQATCTSCHTKKTSEEAKWRKEYRRLNKSP